MGAGGVEAEVPEERRRVSGRSRRSERASAACGATGGGVDWSGGVLEHDRSGIHKSRSIRRLRRCCGTWM